MSATDVVPDQPGFVVTVADVLSPIECARLIRAIERGENGVALLPPTAADLRPKKNEALLQRDSCAVVDPAMCAALWARLSPALPTVRLDGRVLAPVGLVGDGRMGDATPSQLKVYRYCRGHSFGLHVDVSRKGSCPREETEYTLLIYLNSEGQPTPAASAEGGDAAGNAASLVGGHTVFMRTAKAELCRVAPVAGRALLHAHGRRCLLHEGAWSSVVPGRAWCQVPAPRRCHVRPRPLTVFFTVVVATLTVTLHDSCFRA